MPGTTRPAGWSRSPSRTAPAGIVSAIAEARALLATTGRGPVGPYQVQAAIAALHAAATSADDVNWPGSPTCTACSTGWRPRRSSPSTGPSPSVGPTAPARRWRCSRRSSPRGGWPSYAPLHAAHADLLDRAGDQEGAIAAWQRAAEAARNPAEQAALARRAAVS